MPITAGLFHCQGDDRKCNWLYIRPAPGSTRCIVFFPGDLSDFAASAGLPYCYSLEALFWVICLKYPDDDIVLVKPRMLVEHFAVYVNFMMVDGTGNPRIVPEAANDTEETPQVESNANDVSADSPRAVAQLRCLLESARAASGTDLSRRLVLIGFSKGATVLGALLREASVETEFWKSVEAVHFVDAGLNVPGIVYPARSKDLQVLRQTVASDFVLWLHSTRHPSRPWVDEETEAFGRRCVESGVTVERNRYGESVQADLNLHFDSMRCFYTGLSDYKEGDADQHCGYFAAWASGS